MHVHENVTLFIAVEDIECGGARHLFSLLSYLFFLFFPSFKQDNFFLLMASFSFPIPLVRGVILPLVFYYSESLHEWKQKLPIIGVCQLWRQLALEYVYNQAFFVDYDLYVKNVDNLRQRRGQYYYKRGVKSVKTALVSNFELLIALDKCYMVTNIHAFLSYHRRTNLFLDEFFKILDRTKGNWINVTDVYFLAFLLPEENVIDYAFMYFKDKDLYLDRLVDYVTNTFPALKRTKICHYLDIAERLANKNYFYKDLHCIKSNMSHLCIYPHLPQNICILDLTFDYTDSILRLPIIYAESLQQLELQDLPSDFDWSCFSNIDVPYFTNVTFARLVKLYVSYRDNYDDRGNRLCDSPAPVDNFGVKLIFPKLDNLVVVNCCRHNSLLYAEFPNRASKVLYSGSISSIALCHLIKIKGKELMLDVDFADKQSETLFYATTNSMFAGDDKIKSSLFLSGIDFSIDTDRIKWECVRALVVYTVIDFADLALLLKKLPGLKAVCLFSNTIQGILMTIDFAFNRFTQATDFVLSSSLDVVNLICEFEPYYYPEFLVFAKIMISYCPNLKKIMIDYIFKDDIEMFVQGHKSIFPNLDKLQIVYGVFFEYNS